jgi:hypothetical protein
MPNGRDKNWVRLLGALNGFRARYGFWPTKVRIFPGALRNIREDLFSSRLFLELNQKVQLVGDDCPFVAEDDQGNSYSYGKEGFVYHLPSPDARERLGLEPDLHR